MTRDKIKNISIVVVIFLMGCSYLVYKKYLTPLSDEWVEVQLNSQRVDNEPLEIMIHLSGAVYSPGLYTYSNPKRVIDAIKKAGGLLSNANTDRVNLAKFIYDGQHIHVPFKKDRKTSKKSKRNRKNKYK